MTKIWFQNASYPKVKKYDMTPVLVISVEEKDCAKFKSSRQNSLENNRHVNDEQAGHRSHLTRY